MPNGLAFCHGSGSSPYGQDALEEFGILLCVQQGGAFGSEQPGMGGPLRSP